MSIQSTKELDTNISIVSVRSQSMTVLSQSDKEEAIGVIKEIKEQRSKIIAFFKDSKEKAHSTWKSIVAQEKSYTDKLDEVEKTIKGAVLKFDRAEEEKREAERRRLQAIANEQARKERERLLKQAEKLKTPEKKEALIEQAETIQSSTIIVEETEKVSGVSSRKTWKARVVNAADVPRDWLVVNEKALDAFAKSTKGSVKVAGVEFYEETILAVR